MAVDPDAAGKAVLGQQMSGGYLQPLSPDASKEQQTAVLNDIIARLNNMLKSQVFSDGDNKRMLIGYQKDGWGAGKDFGIKVSMEGVDVASASDEQLLFSMDLISWVWFTNGNPQVLVGAAPDDNRAGVWVTKPGQNVRTKLGG